MYNYYLIKYFQMDPTYEAPEFETRTLFGLHMEQKRNDAKINHDVFSNVVTKRSKVTDSLYLQIEEWYYKI